MMNRKLCAGIIAFTLFGLVGVFQVRGETVSMDSVDRQSPYQTVPTQPKTKKAQDTTNYYRLAQVGTKEEIIEAFKKNPNLSKQTFGDLKENFLMLALKNDRDLSIIKTITNGGCSAIATNINAASSIIYASLYTSDPAVMKYLILHGTTFGIGVRESVQAIDHTGHTAFDYAKMNPVPDILSVLEKYGKDPTQEQKNKVLKKYNPDAVIETPEEKEEPQSGSETPENTETKEEEPEPLEEIQRIEADDWTINSTRWRHIGSANIEDEESEEPPVEEKQEPEEPPAKEEEPSIEEKEEEPEEEPPAEEEPEQEEPPVEEEPEPEEPPAEEEFLFHFGDAKPSGMIRRSNYATISGKRNITLTV